MTVKLSISLPDDDVIVIDRYAANHGIANRSAALHAIVQEHADAQLEADYVAAMIEWEDSGEAALWDVTSADGLEDERW
jgi:metal-responsive CopG/Arc/MetJ family transcriptional regulator